MLVMNKHITHKPTLIKYTYDEFFPHIKDVLDSMDKLWKVSCCEHRIIKHTGMQYISNRTGAMYFEIVDRQIHQMFTLKHSACGTIVD